MISKPEIKIPPNLEENFWLVAADMGYGHQRAIYPLKALAKDGIIVNANTSMNSTKKEMRLWRKMLHTYEFMSRAGSFPIIGNYIKHMLDGVLFIPKYYPLRDNSGSTFQVKYLKKRIKKGLCMGVTEQIKTPEMPMITSFYSSAIAADMAGHKKIFCIICDTDLSRVWAAENASTSNIVYFASGSVSAQRLLSYGVPEKNILLTGFPLPLELLGNRNLNTLKSDLSRRLANLDPQKVFYNLYKHSVESFLKDSSIVYPSDNFPSGPITITYAVGGAGAQKEIGRQVVGSLADKIESGQFKVNLVAGTRKELRDYFLRVKDEVARNSDNVQVIYAEDNDTYFSMFNECLHNTDILWTKPSELSFYCALGIPVIMTPAIGPQEKCNRNWLRETGSGFKQQNPQYTYQWLIDLLNKGRLAEAAWLGFLKARKFGTYNILDYLEKGSFTPSNDPLKR